LVRLVCFLKRKPGTTRSEFDAYWRDHHGPLVASTKSGSHVRRYEQLPAATDGEWDGITEQWFDSVESFYASIAEDDYKLIEADIPKFLDVDNLVFMLTDEPRTVIG
jgi:uncharacterized protein (TIGR02118 family)